MVVVSCETRTKDRYGKTQSSWMLNHVIRIVTTSLKKIKYCVPSTLTHRDIMASFMPLSQWLILAAPKMELTTALWILSLVFCSPTLLTESLLCFIRQIFLLIFISCILHTLNVLVPTQTQHAPGRKSWTERCVMGDEDVDGWIILNWIWALYLRREGLYSSGSRKRHIAEWIWMMDRVKDKGAYRRGLFYFIRISLHNSSGSLVSLSQSSTELALWGFQ
jgi:hypothetical protein